MKDLSIINGIKQGGLHHDKAIGYLYTQKKFRTPIFSFIRSKGIHVNDAQSLWTDIVIQFGKLVIKGKYQHEGNIIGYLKNMSRYMVLNHFRDNKKYNFTDIEDISYSLSMEEDLSIYNNELKGLIIGQLDLLGDTCKEILLLWSRDYSMAEIMKKVNVVSIEATRKRKHTCLKKLLDNVSKDDKYQVLLKQYL